MNITGVSQAILARIQADTGSGGVWETAGVYKALSVNFIEGKRGTVGEFATLCPYIVYDFENATTDEDAFASDLNKLMWTIHVWDDKKNANATAPGGLRGSGMVDRLYGDGIAQTNRAPTYGFHRHQLVLTTTGAAAAPWAAGMVSVERLDTAHDEEAYHWILEISVRLARTHT